MFTLKGLLRTALLLSSALLCLSTSSTTDSLVTESNPIPEATEAFEPSSVSPITENISSLPNASGASIISTTEDQNETFSPSRDALDKLSSQDAGNTSSVPSEINVPITPKDIIDKVTTLLEEYTTAFPQTSVNSRAISGNDLELTSQPESTTPTVLQKWLHLENITKIFAKSTVNSLLSGVIGETGSMNISSSCRRDVLKFLVGLRNIKTWAFSLIDASGKIIDGMLYGTMSTLGDFDQCLDIKATNDRKGKNFGQVMFTGQYCGLDITPPLPPKKQYYKLNDVPDELKEFAKGDNIINEAAKASQFFHFLAMRLGICVPSGCQPSDLQQVADRVAKDTYFTVKVKRCEVKEENVYTPLIIAVMTAMCFFGFLLVVGSLIDLYHRYAQKKISNLALEILVSFSLPSNFKKLVSTKSLNENTACLGGLRFLSISWVILGHTYLNTNYTISKGLRKATEFQKDFFFQAIVNASVAVDTFFFLGGLLVCYVTVKVVIGDKKPFSILLYLMHRVFRLLPVYIMIISFIYLAPILGSGPVFHDTVDPFLESCYKNWWTNILFVNNFVNTNQICLPQSWYVACDMQLYIGALVILLPLLRWPWVGLTIASFGIAASVAGTVAMTYFYEYPPTMLFVHPDIEQRLAYWANAYFKPYSHVGPYCIGLIVGYVLATHPKLKFSLATRIIGWSAAIACNISVLYGVHEWNKGRDPELVESLLYSGLHRIAWAFGVAWIVLNCVSGQGGVVNYILSWRVWIPLGRLTYTIYLIHPIVQIAAVGNVRMRAMIVHYFIIWIFFGHLMITIGSAFAASMLVEAPFISLEKLVLRAIIGKPKAVTNGIATARKDSTEPKSISSTDNGIEAIPSINNNGTARNGAISHL